MARIRTQLVLGPGGIQAAVPTGTMVPGSFQGGDATTTMPDGLKLGVAIGDPKLANVTVAVDIPDDEVDAQGQVDKARMRQKYPTHFLTQSGRFG